MTKIALQLDEKRWLDGLTHTCPATNTEEHYGYMYHHPRPDNGEPCKGGVPTCSRCQKNAWLIVGGQREPNLTLYPSIQCLTCGEHGFVRDGKWVPA